MQVAVSGLALGPNILGQDVNLRIAYRNDFQGHSMQARERAGKGSTPALKPVRRVIPSPKQRVPVAPQKDLGPQKI